MTRGDHPVTNLGIHPGELHPRCTTTQQTISRIDTNAIDGAFYMPVNNRAECQEEFIE